MDYQEGIGAMAKTIDTSEMSYYENKLLLHSLEVMMLLSLMDIEFYYLDHNDNHLLDMFSRN